MSAAFKDWSSCISVVVPRQNPRMIAEYALTKYILWVAPPISDVVSWFTNEIYYNMGEVMRGFILLLIYGVVMAGGKVELLRKVKF